MSGLIGGQAGSCLYTHLSPRSRKHVPLPRPESYLFFLLPSLSICLSGLNPTLLGRLGVLDGTVGAGTTATGRVFIEAPGLFLLEVPLDKRLTCAGLVYDLSTSPQSRRTTPCQTQGHLFPVI